VASLAWMLEEDDQLRAAAVSGESIAAISKRLCRSESAIYGRARKLGIAPPCRDYSAGLRWTPEEDGLLRSTAAAGESASVIAQPLKRSADSVRKRARTLKIKLAHFPSGPKPRTK
jgi:hypothetical protein